MTTAEKRHRVRIKICCISSADEARAAIDAGADYLGLVSSMPSGPGVISDDQITRLRDDIADRAQTVVLTSRTTASGIADQLQQHRPDVIQLCDTVPSGELATLRRDHPGMILMQVIHVRDASSVADAESIAPHVDAILLDSGNPGATIRELGGTGRVHDWTMSRMIRERVDIPVFLAGGLHADNVGEAIDVVRPWGVDVCTGVRSEGALSRTRLEAFVRQVQNS